MLYLGTDEAGYGPNLGPLVVTASLWSAEEVASAEFDFYKQLRAAVIAEKHSSLIPIADSKQLYSSGSSLAMLECGLFAALGMLKHFPISLTEFCHAVHSEWHTVLPWQAKFEQRMPIHLSVEKSHHSLAQLQAACQTTNIGFLGVRAALVQPETFNEQCAQLGNKATVLSTTALKLVRDWLLLYPTESMLMVCDKHGGRNRYAALLMSELLTAEGVEHPFALTTVIEGRDQSVYRWQNATGAKREIRFVAKGERFLPAAFASMTAKYLRELSMMAWNHFWQQHIPDLAPTAGYPLDAARFRSAIAPIAAKLNLPQHTWWRNV
jgi:hypothetical protein